MALRDEDLRQRSGKTLIHSVPGLSRRGFLHAGARVGAGVAAASALPLAGLRAVFASHKAVALPAGPAGAGSLGAHAAAHGILYGCAVDARALAADPAYAALIREQCRILVAENAMKWVSLRPTADRFNFDAADALVAFAEENHMKLRGHNLVWHRDNPKWFDATLNAANARKFLTTHIETVVGRYAGRMHSWDVVNEAIEIKDGRSDGMRNTVWLRLVGDDYLELAFRTARDADPQALLTYNEYGIEGETPEAEQKRQSVMGMLRRMVARHVPVDAVGVQAHLSALAVPASGDGPAYGDGMMRFIAAARELGLQVFVTEMDVDDRASPASVPFRDAAVEVTYQRFLDLVLGDPAVRVVLTWGITDRYTWLDREGARNDGQPVRPLPFDMDYKPAPAFFAMRDAFDRREKA